MDDVSINFANMPEEQRRIRAKCHHPTGVFVPFPAQATEQAIPTLFETRVQLTPHRLAVQDRYQALTYEELNQAANRIAHAILELCDAGEETIGLLLDHSVAMVAAIFGVLKAGKIYVPLDVSYPHARLEYMVQDAQLRLIITHEGHRPLAHALGHGSIQALSLDQLAATLPDTNPGLALAPDTLAYILYTSGSTGQPKGVVETHRNILVETRRSTNSLHYCPDDRVAVSHAFGFSAHVRRLYPALLNGASGHLLDIKRENARALIHRVIDEGITALGVAGFSAAIYQALRPEDFFPSLRVLTLGAQIVFPADVMLWRQHMPSSGIIIINYAITETGTVSQYFTDHHTALPDHAMPVGYAAADSAVMVCDEDGNQVEDHEVGEICVKSRYLSPGYWRQPDLTAAAFVADPQGRDERIYRTGDIGRRLPDGCLQHLGRKDAQVKVRGHRIEMTEVESALRRLEAVQQAVVVARGNTPNDTQLIAYIVPDAQRPPTVSALRRGLAACLPEYMVPERFVLLDALPLNAHNKIDRHALPSPGNARPLLETPLVAPRTPIEAALASIWAEVLGLEQVGINDHFFELGGQSLLATQILARLIAMFRVELPLQALWEAPTVAKMATVVTKHQAAQADQPTIARMLAEVEALSAAQVEQQMTGEVGG